MNVEDIIKEIEFNFNDIKKSLKENNAECLTPLFREYTDEIIKIIKQ